MGIDGVGKPGGLPPSAVVGTSDASGVSESFQLNAQEASVSSGSDALGRLQRGEIGLDEYLDVQVEDALGHLQELPADQLEFVRHTLREELRSDPVLIELVRRATGVTPSDLER